MWKEGGVMSSQQKGKDSFYTYSDYKNWPDTERWEIIDGEAFDMSPAPGMTHQRITTELARLIGNYFVEKSCRVFHAPFDVFLQKSNEEMENCSTVVQPDISVICDENKLSEKGCTGAPDFVIEVVSPSSGSYDQITKLRLYEKHGVKEFWLIHPRDRILRQYVLQNDLYARPILYDYKGKPESHLFRDLVIDLYKLFDVKESDYVTERPSHYVKL